MIRDIMNAIFDAVVVAFLLATIVSFIFFAVYNFFWVDILKLLKLLCYTIVVFFICWYIAFLHLSIIELTDKLDRVPSNLEQKIDLLLYMAHIQTLDCT